MAMSLDDWETAIAAALREALGVKVTIGQMPAAPDRVVTVKAYADPPSPEGFSTRLIRFQVRCRQAPDATPPTANRLAEQARDALLGHGVTLTPEAPSARITHLSTATLGLDDKRRDRRTENFQITTHH